MSLDRYAHMFERLARQRAGAFVPFTVLGDPDLQRSASILRTLVRAGADALELGIPFSDPVADGPTIQRADGRALAAGVRTQSALELVADLRREHPDVPVGLLVYANLVVAPGLRTFYEMAARAGVDSVLVADVPTVEAPPFCAAARAAGVAPVLLAAPGCSDAHLDEIVRLGQGYTYVVTRSGVTGAEREVQAGQGSLLQRLLARGGPPPIVGFGISTPAHVRATLHAGAAGAISGSAVVARIEALRHDSPALATSLAEFVREMKAATLP